ncbi:zinc-dependent metalloprotease [Zhihengliuella flava]|uniref:Hydrolase n=1 Tax=Zhihengliuella flava TaxID=1285193 RepID=A0A931DAZ4_9MICC|nr:zinc-dependent metalloprotease [Zhihengliuella flava]MBG6085584.1 putative hydrolase [Zhihengliuella flava]
MADNHENNRPDGSDDDNGKDPFAEMFSNLFGGNLPGGMNPQDLPEDVQKQLGDLQNNPQAMQNMFRQMQQLMGAMASGESGPVNWSLAIDSARQAAAGDDPTVTGPRQQAVADAGRLAEMWLDQATAFDSAGTDFTAISRAQWVTKTMDTWKVLTSDVAQSMSEAMTRAMTDQAPEEMKSMLAGAQGMFQNLGGAMFGMQLGTAVGGLAKDVFGGTDIGLPLAGNSPVLVPANVSAFGEDLEAPEQEVLLFMVLREAAHIRLFARAPWLRGHVVSAIESYARGIHIDMSKIEESLRDIDPMNPESFQSQAIEGLFTPQHSDAQRSALEKLETALALIEGWVDQVVAEASANLPAAGALREMLRRRRATGGPAEQAFASLVGLELRPRRLRDASAFWAAMREERGVAGRDDIWSHPDLMPTSEDLDDPAGFTERRRLAEAADSEIDEALDKLLSGGFDEPDTGDSDGSAPEDPKA